MNLSKHFHSLQWHFVLKCVRQLCICIRGIKYFYKKKKRKKKKKKSINDHNDSNNNDKRLFNY